MKKQSKSGSGNVKGKSVTPTTPEMILESMKCPVCTELLLSPIYQCERGHNICNACVEEVHECPLCKGDYGDTRNYFAEDLVNSMILPCKYREYGCLVTCLGSLLKEHQENCELQPYRCPELACQQLIGEGQMHSHLERHGFKVMTGDSHMATFDIQDKHFDAKTEYNPWRIQAFGREFYTVATRQRDKNWYFWAWILALPKEAKKYYCEIILSSSQKQVLYRGSVHSLRIAPEEIIKGAEALVVTDQLIRAMRENGKVTCKVRFIQGKNWDKESKKEKPLVQAKKDAKKAGSKGKVKIPYTIPTHLRRTQSISSALTAIKKSSKPSVVPTLKTSKAGSVATKAKAVTTRSKSAVNSSSKTAVNTSPKFRKPSVSEAEQSLILKIRESLKCPGCAESVSPPILLCTVGHSVCDACRVKYGSNCPLCRCPITGTRNFFAEELLYKTLQKCRFEGCDVCLPAIQIRLHEDTCDFAPYECPFSSCRKVFEPKDLLDHMKTHDIPSAKDELNMVIPFPKSTTATICAIPSIVLTQGLVFYPLVLRETNGVWSFWVASNDSTNFIYELRIKKQSKMLAFQGHVMSLRLSPNQVVLRGEGLITTEKAIKNFKANDKFDFSLKIAPIRGFEKSGITFLTPFCSGTTAGVANTIVTASTELFANQNVSNTIPAVPTLHGGIYAGMRPNTYARLFATDEDEEDELAGRATPSSRSSNSIKKSKSALSVSSSDFQDFEDSCFDEIKVLQGLILETSQANVTFNAVHLSENVVEGRPVELPDTGTSTAAQLKDSGNDEKCDDDDDSKSQSQFLEVEQEIPIKKKSALKLKESTSPKKVEFNPTTEIFSPQIPEQPDKDKNNNELMQNQETGEMNEAVVAASTVQLNACLSETSLLNRTAVKANSVIHVSQAQDSIKLNSKVETFSRSCTDLKNCGSRESMKNKIQQLSNSVLGAIREEDEECGSDKVEERTENVNPWKEITEKGEANEESVPLPKEISQDLIDLGGEKDLVTSPQGNSMTLGEFDGPIELIIQAADKVASISLSNIRQNTSNSKVTIHGSSSVLCDGSYRSNFDLEIPIAVSPSIEYVDETETACQVGSSLMRIIEEDDKTLYRSDILNLEDVNQGIEIVAEGITSTYNVVKNIISGMIPQKPVIEEKGSEEEIVIPLTPVARLPDDYGQKLNFSNDEQ